MWQTTYGMAHFHGVGDGAPWILDKFKENNYPIGSGEIQSGHRYVIQQRVKLAGCWWKETNAQLMLNLRTARANGIWKHYWN